MAWTFFLLNLKSKMHKLEKKNMNKTLNDERDKLQTRNKIIYFSTMRNNDISDSVLLSSSLDRVSFMLICDLNDFCFLPIL